MLVCTMYVPVCTAVVPVFSTPLLTIVFSMASVHLCSGTISGPIQFFGLSLFFFCFSCVRRQRVGRGGRDERGCGARCARQAARVRHRGGGWPAGTARLQEDAHFAENG